MNTRKTHQSYFNSEAGKELIGAINQLITNNYQSAERSEAEKFMARAFGNREVMTLIQSITAELKGGRTD